MGEQEFLIYNNIMTYVDYIDERIRECRKALRGLRFSVGLTGFWTLCLIGFWVWGVASWVDSVSSLLLMAFTGWLLWRAHKEYRGRIARLEADRDEALRRVAVNCGVVSDDAEFIDFDDDTHIDLDPRLSMRKAFNLEPGTRVKVMVIRED